MSTVMSLRSSVPIHLPSSNLLKSTLTKKPLTKSEGAPVEFEQPIITRRERNDVLATTLRKQNELSSLIITKSSISLFSWEDMQKIAGTIKITNANLVGSGSVNDPRMGLVSATLPAECPYCRQIDCAGHYGLIEFGTPIYNPAFIRDIIAILTCVCNDCGGLLVPEDICIQKGWMNLAPDKRLGQMEEYCKGVNKCLRQNPQIGQGNILPCDSNPVFVTTDIKDKGEITYKRPEQGTKKITKNDDIHPMMMSAVVNILNRVSDADAKLMGYLSGNHPRNMIMYGCLVPPTIARTPIFKGGIKHHDKLTHMYVAIKRTVDAIKTGKKTTGDLYAIIKQLIFKTETNKVGLKGFLSIIERIQGKNALLRGLLMGKRGNYCGRTVAGPDPSLKFGQIRVPEVWASILTKRVTVTTFNIKHLQQLFDEKKIVHIISSKTGLREFYGDRPDHKLVLGTKVERWLENGDRVVINRQPTLHRQSKMAYEVVLGKELTIGLHLSYTTPMNCDFDGDENNLWLPRDLEVEAEVEILINVKNNIMSSEQNRPIMGLVMNSISSAFLMTKTDRVIDNDLFDELLELITDKNNLLTLNTRLAKWGVAPFSGAAIFSAMLPHDFFYNQKGILIIDGVLIAGRIKKSTIGATHRSIIQELYKKYGQNRTAEFFTDAPWVLNKWILETGFSVGLLDMINLIVDPETKKEYDNNEKVTNQELTKIYIQLEALNNKLDDPLEELDRNRKIANLSDIANGIGIRLANEVLAKDNSIGVMTEKGAGTKGAVANIANMCGSVGQQFLYGKRLQPTITGGRRTLPTFDENETNPEAHGFLPQSFFKGLTPEGLFFLQTGGRSSLLDTSLNTAESGNISHKMTKAFENIVVGYDGSVRNTIGTLFNPMYNSGYDISEMMMVDCNGKPDLSSFVDIKSLVSELNIKRGWIPKDVDKNITTKRTKLYPEFKPEPKSIVKFIEEPNIFGNKMPISKYEKSRIIGARSHQLSNGDLSYINFGEERDAVKIALREYDEGILPLHIIRKYPDGTSDKVYPTKQNQLQ